MPRLAPIERGPWAPRKAATRRDLEGLDGPDYDPGTPWVCVVCAVCAVKICSNLDVGGKSLKTI